jgi:hypothetical protein
MKEARSSSAGGPLHRSRYNDVLRVADGFFFVAAGPPRSFVIAILVPS